jgi:hypothetical protein
MPRSRTQDNLAQEKYVKEQMTHPMPCPICCKPVSYVAAVGEELFDEQGAHGLDWECTCPFCHHVLVYTVYVFGPPAFIIKKGQKISYDPNIRFVFTMEDKGETLYWSNNDGWVSRETATVFFIGDHVTPPMEATGREEIT